MSPAPVDVPPLSRSERFWQRWLMRIRPAFVASALKRLLRLRRRLYRTADGVFWIDPVSQFGAALTAPCGYEPDMAATLQRWLRPGAVFVDVGANEGYFTVLGAQQVGAQGRVLAIEPQARLWPVIERNLALNGCSHVPLCRVAVGDRHGEAELHVSPDTNTGSTGLVRATRYRVPTVQVPLLPLRAVLEQHGVEQVDLLKMDIEGFEYEAILGSPELFRSGRIRALALELHPPAMTTRGLDPQAILDFLQTAGYQQALDAPTQVWVHTANQKR